MNLYEIDIGNPRFSPIYVIGEDFKEVEKMVIKKILPLGIIPGNSKSLKSITFMAKCITKADVNNVNGNLLISPKLIELIKDLC